MTEQIDLDALIAVLRKGDGNGCRQPTEAMRTAAEYLDELRAELRQERAKRRPIALRELMDAEAALSRAEETIESTLAWLRDDRFTIEGRARQAEDDLATYLTGYDKQKGADLGRHQ